MNTYLDGYQKGMDDALEMVTERMPGTVRSGYEQGIEHVMIIARTLSAKRFDSIEAFLLELSIELNKLKEPKKETCENL